MQAQSVILEKDNEVTKDPRGVYLTGDAVRILYNLGLGHKISDIGHGEQRSRQQLEILKK